MKHKVELDSLFSAIRYCATADNNNDFWERWDRLKVTEQLEALAKATFFDDWQTNEQMEFALHRAENANAECKEIDELLAPFWDITPETTESRYLLGQWAGIQIHIMGEMHELREYIRTKKEPEKTKKQKEIEFIHRVIAHNEQKRNTQQKISSTTTEPEQGSEGAHDQLLEKIMRDKILYPKFKDVIKEDDLGHRYKTSAAEILRKIINDGIDAQAKGKGKKKSHWKDKIKKAIDFYPNNHNLEELDYNALMKGFEYYGIEIDEKTAGRWLTDWRNNK